MCLTADYYDYLSYRVALTASARATVVLLPSIKDKPTPGTLPMSIKVDFGPKDFSGAPLFLYHRLL